jgi:hypothetical protein
MDNLQTEKTRYCQIVKISKFDYLVKDNIFHRTNGIFSTFSRTLTGRGGLNPIQQRREAESLSRFVHQEIVHPILISYQSILESQVEFDMWHRLRILELVDTCPITWNDGNKLTVGMAQKIVNLHCKDIWALDIIPAEYSQYFHIVIDAITLNNIGFENIAWTKINEYRKYFDFQKGYRELGEIQRVTPLEIECRVWNENSKK